MCTQYYSRITHVYSILSNIEYYLYNSLSLTNAMYPPGHTDGPRPLGGDEGLNVAGTPKGPPPWGPGGKAGGRSPGGNGGA